ncbi:MAG: PilZ domain-containing protein [Nitrospira sp.]
MGLRCPECEATSVRRTTRRGLLENLLSTAYIYPYRCEACSSRFHSLEWGRRYTKGTPAGDRRRYERFEVRCPAWFAPISERELNGHGEAVLTDVSLGGCGLKTDAPLALGTALRLQIQTWEDQVAIRVDHAVVRSIRPGLVGLEFVQFQPGEKQRLDLFVKSLLAVGRC